ncbi:MAG TPA: integrase core domain-containing protein [Thermoanaerobaculia bacterium]|nr:integrase core domain-containing protein [Thermoanaerobaculia bacterium]
MANVLKAEKRAAVIRALVDCNSIRATVRQTGVAKNTVTKLLVELGAACAAYQDEALRNLTCKRLQVDEIWAFVYAKAKNVPAEKRGVPGVGDVWTFVAIDADTKLVPSFLVGSRDAGTATEFMQDLAGRLVNRVQLTTDGHGMYLNAVLDSFGGAVDYAQLQKIYGGGPTDEAHRYSPAKCLGTERRRIIGDPDRRHVSTSYVERQNLTMRTSMKRFARLTNAFSKKAENLAAAVALHFMHYNFARPHQSLGGRTPAQAAGVTDRRWTAADIVGLLGAGPKS